MNRGIRWDAEYVVLTAVATLIGLAVMKAVHILWMLGMIWQNVVAG